MYERDKRKKNMDEGWRYVRNYYPRRLTRACAKNHGFKTEYPETFSFASPSGKILRRRHGVLHNHFIPHSFQITIITSQLIISFLNYVCS
jgi:hypothetical protein